MEKFYESSNPYENYGKPTIAECDNCYTELIEDDEVYIFEGLIYCSKNCILEKIDFEEIALMDFIERE